MFARRVERLQPKIPAGSSGRASPSQGQQDKDCGSQVRLLQVRTHPKNEPRSRRSPELAPGQGDSSSGCRGEGSKCRRCDPNTTAAKNTAGSWGSAPGGGTCPRHSLNTPKLPKSPPTQSLPHAQEAAFAKDETCPVKYPTQNPRSITAFPGSGERGMSTETGV